jgi:subtilase family serine protease
MRTTRPARIAPIAAAALAITALASPAMPATAGGTSGTPTPDPRQIKVLTAALATMAQNYEALAQNIPGVADIYDYGIGSLWKQGIDGAGTTIAVLEGWDDPDVARVLAAFDKPLGLPDPRLQTIYPAGPLPAHCPPGMARLGSYGSCSAWAGELELDVEAAHLVAPYAKIVISATPADTEVTDDAASQVAPPEMMKAVETIASKHLADVISISDGTGESTYSYGAAEIDAQDPGELAAAAAGIPVLVGTGDCGAVQNLAVANGQCADTSGTPDTAAWDDSPWVTAVGGTVPHLGQVGQRLGPDPMWHVAGVFSAGAGFSSVYPRPAYQDAVNAGPMRSVPDISMDASNGTSEATPLLAGVLALATQASGADVGPVNPALYQVLGPAGAKDGIADVVSGDNSVVKSGKVVVPGFSAAPGYDVATGWGTLYAPRFVPALVAAAKAAGQQSAARRNAAAALKSLQNIRAFYQNGNRYYLWATGFLPMHPVQLAIDGTRKTTLHANPLGDVTDMIGPLPAGPHQVTLTSLLLTESATLNGGPAPAGGAGPP